ncbi:hypothetical protein EYF80_012883 [Liparis tanakae]|uniref:Uncharacterized protein n=1 Tax=Liparis tanakae TaxID=230148 RepID=A0A4Z2IFY4_9TELE|nr:hypothetical protein EYF80_012883 [Liparis tanakae]
MESSCSQGPSPASRRGVTLAASPQRTFVERRLPSESFRDEEEEDDGALSLAPLREPRRGRLRAGSAAAETLCRVICEFLHRASRIKASANQTAERVEARLYLPINSSEAPPSEPRRQTLLLLSAVAKAERATVLTSHNEGALRAPQASFSKTSTASLEFRRSESLFLLTSSRTAAVCRGIQIDNGKS